MGWGTPWLRRSEGAEENSGGGRLHPPITAWNHQAEKLGIEEKTASPFPSDNLISEQFVGTHLPDAPYFTSGPFHGVSPGAIQQNWWLATLPFYQVLILFLLLRWGTC